MGLSSQSPSAIPIVGVMTSLSSIMSEIAWCAASLFPLHDSPQLRKRSWRCSGPRNWIAPWSLSLPILPSDFHSCRSTIGHCVERHIPRQINRPRFSGGQPMSNLPVSFSDSLLSPAISVILLQMVSLMLGDGVFNRQDLSSISGGIVYSTLFHAGVFNRQGSLGTFRLSVFFLFHFV